MEVIKIINTQALSRGFANKKDIEMIRFKINILAALKAAGYSQTVLQREILSKSVVQSLKDGGNITLDSLNKVCVLTGLQPGEILEYKEVPEEKEKILKK